MLECHSPTKTLEIWIPELLDRADRNGHFHGSHTDPKFAPQIIEPKRETPPLPGVEQKAGDPSTPTGRSRRGRSRKPKKESRAKPAGPEAEKHEDAQPKIEFPKDE